MPTQPRTPRYHHEEAQRILDVLGAAPDSTERTIEVLVAVCHAILALTPQWHTVAQDEESFGRDH